MEETTKRHPLVEDYLKRLERAAATLPRARRKELMADTEAYLAQALKPESSNVEVRATLGGLGEPEQLVREDRPRPEPDPEGLEWSAVVLLAVGGLFLGIGWIFGVILLWRSKTWTVADKLIGTFLWPGGLVTGLILAAAYIRTGEGGAPFVVIGVVGVPLLTAGYLAWRARA